MIITGTLVEVAYAKAVEARLAYADIRCFDIKEFADGGHAAADERLEARDIVRRVDRRRVKLERIDVASATGRLSRGNRQKRLAANVDRHREP